MGYFMGTGAGKDLGYKAGTPRNLPGTGDGVTGGSGSQANDMWNQLLGLGYSEAEIEQILQLAELEGQTGILKDQMEHATKLRETETTPGIDSGRVFTAANPLQHIGDFGQRYKGEQEAKSIDEERQRILEETTAARLAFLRTQGTPPIVGDTTADPLAKPRAGRGFMYG
jgi:hypothetical protein